MTRRFQSKSLRQVRNFFPLLAAILTLIGIFVPFWQLSMRAPQYPETVLKIAIFSYKMAGDIFEFDTLNHYAGVSFPEHLPEFRFLPYLLVVLALLALLAAFVSGPGRNKLLRTTLGLYLILLIASTVDLQYQLYRVGHDLDPNRPLVGIKTFTPPIVGPNQVGNMHTFSMFGWGAWLVGLAVALLFAAYRYHDSELGWRELLQRVCFLPARKLTHRLWQQGSQTK